MSLVQTPHQDAWVLYDGECSFCIEFVERWKPALSKRGFRFETLQTDWVREKLGFAPGEIPEEMKVLFADGRQRGGADAVLYLASQIWWMKPSVWIARLPGIYGLVDRNYKRIAANRRCRIGGPDLDEAFRKETLRITAVSASLGALTVLGLAGLSFAKGSFSTILFFLLLGPLVLAPLALRAWVLHRAVPGKSTLFRWVVLLQPFAALTVLGSVLFGKGAFSAALASGWLGTTALLGIYGVVRLLRGPVRNAADLSFVGASLLLPVGGIWLALARLGANPFGVEEPIVTLTAVHFHYTAFAAPTLFGLFAMRTKMEPWILRIGLFGLFAGIVTVAAGFMSSSAVRLLGALFLSLGLAILGANQLFGRAVFRGWRGAALRFGGLSLLGGMALALYYATGDFLGSFRIAIDEMALYHGALNGLSFVTLGLLAWQGSAEAVEG